MSGLNLETAAIVWPSKPRWTRDELVRELRTALNERAERAYLIGSYARGTATGESDVDLIIVSATDHPWPERWRAYADLQVLLGGADIIVYTPAEWLALERHPSPFVAHARESWLELEL